MRRTILIVLAFILAAWPAMLYDVPVAQTDGASYLGFAQALRTEGLDAENPRYNWPGTVEKTIMEYPPGSILLLAGLLTFFSGTALVNGLYGAFMQIIGVLFFYAFVRKILDEDSAFIASLLMLFNVRAYYTLFVGGIPPYTAYALFPAAFYFAYVAIKEGGWNFAFLGVVLGLISFTYPIYTLYALAFIVLLYLGCVLEGKLHLNLTAPRMEKITLPQLKSLALTLGGSLVVLYIALRMHVITGPRTSWIGQWIAGMMGQCGTYPCAWQYFFILDGPLLITLAILGVYASLLQEKYSVTSLMVGTIGLLLFPLLFVRGDILILQWVYRFYTVLTLMFIVSAVFFIQRCKGNMRYMLAGLLIFVQVVKLVGFFSLVGPAMLAEDVGAAAYLQNVEGPIMYINNMEESGFRAFKWVHFMAERNDYTLWIQDGEGLRTTKDYILEGDLLDVGEITRDYGPDLYAGYSHVYVADITKHNNTPGVLAYRKGKTGIYTQ